MSLKVQPVSQEDAASIYGMAQFEVTERLAAMQRQESSYLPVNYLDRLDRPPSRQDDDDITRSCRSKMAHWCYQLTDICTFRRETVTRAMSYLDRFLAAGHASQSSPSARTYHQRRAAEALHDKREYQLASMCCLYVAVKMFEPLSMDASLLSEISHGCYSTAEILSMETSILHVLEWKLNGPTAQDFATHLLAMLKPSAYRYSIDTVKSILDSMLHQIEIAAADYDVALVSPSAVAVASLLNALEGMSQDSLSSKARYSFFSRVVDSVDLDMNLVETVQRRLRSLFYLNSGVDLPLDRSSRDVTQFPTSTNARSQECSCLFSRTPSQELRRKTQGNKITTSPRSTACDQDESKPDVYHARCA